MAIVALGGDAVAQSYHSGDLDGESEEVGVVRYIVTEDDWLCATDLALAELASDPPPACLVVTVAQADLNCDSAFNVSDVQAVGLLYNAPTDSSAVTSLRVTDPHYDVERLYLHRDCNDLSCPYESTEYQAVAAGGETTCALAGDDSMWCWGNDDDGQLGNYLDYDADGERSPVITNREGRYSSLCVGAGNLSLGHTCGIRADDSTLWCWGNNVTGQTAVEDYTYHTAVETPMRVGEVDDQWEGVACGDRHTCGIRKDGSDNELFCWGWNDNGQLGIGAVYSSPPEPTPLLVNNPTSGGSYSKWASVTAGWRFTCATLENDDAYCWGSNLYGQLGDGTGGQQRTPKLVADSHAWALVEAGYQHTCGIDTGGDLYCWGRGQFGQLGISSPPDCSGNCARQPELVDDTETWTTVWGGSGHTCGITAGGSSRLYCWGDNSLGQLGYDTDPDDFSLLPDEVDSSPDWLFGAAGFNHTCAAKQVSSDVELFCWGENSSGQVGNGNTDPSPDPEPEPELVDELEQMCCGDGVCNGPETSTTCPEDGC